MLMRLLSMLVVVTSSGMALGNDLSDLKVGVYQVSPGGPQRIFLGSDLCKQCLSLPAENKPSLCSVVLCRPLDAAARASHRPIKVPEKVGRAVANCPIDAICAPELFEFDRQVLDDVGRIPTYRQNQPYKLWLEGARIQHDAQLRRGEISRSDYREFIKSYRSDWKGLAGR